MVVGWATKDDLLSCTHCEWEMLKIQGRWLCSRKSKSYLIGFVNFITRESKGGCTCSGHERRKASVLSYTGLT